jgi:hypothetical protein
MRVVQTRNGIEESGELVREVFNSVFRRAPEDPTRHELLAWVCAAKFSESFNRCISEVTAPTE